MSETLYIRLLGDFHIGYAPSETVRGMPADTLNLPGFDSPRLQALLAYLLLHRDAPQSRKHLAFLLWSDSSETQAHSNLRNLLHRLRLALPNADHFLTADVQTLLWHSDAPFVLDVDEFEQAARHTDSIALLQSAIDLYRGELLPASYDEWVIPPRERLHELYIDTLSQLVILREQAHAYRAAIGNARQLLQADPLREQAYRQLLRLYGLTGDRAEVVRVYQTCAAVLRQELDTEPSALTRETFEEARRTAGAHAEAGDRATQAPTKTPEKNNLPVQLTRFIGRARELAALAALLTPDTGSGPAGPRLITLTGVGGCGKTRLALYAAQEAQGAFAGGVCFVDLAPLANPALLAQTIAAALELVECPGQSFAECVTAFINAQEFLLVLDNCEHLADACTELAAALLAACPHLKILATSRKALALANEHVHPVPPLSLPASRHATLPALAHSDAAQLFIERAAAVLPTFTLHTGNVSAVAQICLRLEGLPLAIELAAARVRLLTLEQIAARLDDALRVLTRATPGTVPRHRTLHAVMDWSYNLLAAQERILFRRLAVFAGSFTLDAVEAVCADPVPEPPPDQRARPRARNALTQAGVLDLLSGLADQSLVTLTEWEQGEQARYRLLEPVRQYARDRLERAGENTTFDARQLAWSVALAERMANELVGETQDAALQQLEREHDNLRAALDLALATGDIESGLRLAGALERFWLIRGHPTEGRLWLEQLLVRDLAEVAPAVRARALGVAGLLAFRQNDYDTADTCFRNALELWQALGNTAGIALGLNKLGDVAAHRHAYGRAVELYQESLERQRALGDRRGIASVLISLGAVVSEQGAQENAMALYQEALELCRALGDQWMIAVLLNNLGAAAQRQGDLNGADVFLREALALRRALGDGLGAAIALTNLAESALRRQEWARAAEPLRESLQLFQAVNHADGVATCLTALARVACETGNPAWAARLLGMSETVRGAIHAPTAPDDRADYEAVALRVREFLGEPEFAAAWSEGRALLLAQGSKRAIEQAILPAPETVPEMLFQPAKAANIK